MVRFQAIGDGTTRGLHPRGHRLQSADVTRQLLYPVLAGRALLHRLLPERRSGVTAYYRDGLAGRLEAATWQLELHGRTTRLLDVGCGRDLLLALTAAIRFGKPVIAFDVRPLADLALVNFTLAALGEPPAADLSEIGARYGVTYRIAGQVDAIAEAFDGVASTASFEHIPEQALRQLAGHLAHRLPGAAVVTAEIDYRDHWSFIAPVAADHFYQLSDPAFAILNAPRMFQNRLRHRDITGLFHGHGFTTIAEITTGMALTCRPGARSTRFRHYDEAELAVATARVAWKAA